MAENIRLHFQNYDGIESRFCSNVPGSGGTPSAISDTSRMAIADPPSRRPAPPARRARGGGGGGKRGHPPPPPPPPEIVWGVLQG